MKERHDHHHDIPADQDEVERPAAPPAASDRLYAVVDYAGRLVRQAYAPREAHPPKPIEGLEAMWIDSVMDPERWLWRDGAWQEKPKLAGLDLGEPALVSDDLIWAPDLAEDVVAYTGDRVGHTASGVPLQIQFPASGLQYLRLEKQGHQPWSGRVHVVTLSEAKAGARRDITRIRAERLAAPIDTGKERYDADAASLAAIQQMAQLLDESEPVTWIDHDNNAVELPGSALAALGAAIVHRNSEIMLVARHAKNLIDSAATHAAIAAVLETYKQGGADARD